jgi:protein-S-isoprenylcysteine O-methyltransferase Ste14
VEQFNAMTAEKALLLAMWCWFVMAGVWLVLSFWRKSVKKRETAEERIRHIAPMLFGYWLLFGRTWTVGWLEQIVIPRTQGVLWSGVLLTALGVAISIWARLTLGSNWSGVVTLKDDHELIRKGPYRWVRHPIYTGMLMGFVGTAFVEGRLRGWVGLAVVLVTFYFKARREERFLRQEFGDGFEAHARDTGMFLPKFR